MLRKQKTNQSSQTSTHPLATFRAFAAKKSHRFFAFLCSAVVIFTTVTQSVSAIKDSIWDRYDITGIFYYDPEGSFYNWNGCGYNLSGSTLQEKALSFLLGNNLSPVAAAGIYGNMIAEGLGGNQPLRHEIGVGSLDKVGTCYSAATHYSTCTGAPGSGLRVREADVRDLYNPDIMHGIGFIGWSFGRRINLLNSLGEYAHFATDWNGNSYTYDKYTYEDFASEFGASVANGIVAAELDFFMDEHVSYTVTQSDINAQGLSKYGITAGMNLFDALNLVSTPAEAATLFYSTSEMPGATTLTPTSSRIDFANNGYEQIAGASIQPGSSQCVGANNGDINATAINLAFPEHGHGLIPSDAYRKALDAVGFTEGSGWGDPNVPRGSSCDVFVTTVMKYSGADPDFACCGIANKVEPYLRTSGKYMEVPNDLEHLQPGDIRVSSGHVEIYVEVNGVGKIASASHGGRTGEIGNFYENSATFKAYRLIR